MTASSSPVRRTADDGGESSLPVHDWPHPSHIPWAGFPSPDPASTSNAADTDELVSSRGSDSLSPRATSPISHQRGQDSVGRDWAILTIDAEQTKYLFVKNLPAGNQSIVQLCQRFGDGGSRQFVVRKRSKEPVNATRASRPDRECKIAQAIYLKRNEFVRRRGAPEQRHVPRFAELLSFANIPTGNRENNSSDETKQGKSFFRESFWTYCDGAGTLKDLLTLLAKDKQLPAALILHFMHQVLCAVQWLNSETGTENGMAIFHCDLNCRNIFLEWDEQGSLQPVIGDFGYSRLEPPHEATWNDRTLFIPSFNDSASEVANLSSPPADYVAFQNPQDRMPLDFAHFAETLYRLLQVIIEPATDDDDVNDEKGEHEAPSDTQHQYDAVLSLLEALLEKGREDRARAPRPDISHEIARAAALLSQQLQEDGGQQVKRALASWAQSMPSVSPFARDGRSLRPLTFATEEAARITADAQGLGATGPYAVVNVCDAASVAAGVRSLVKMRQCGRRCDDDDEGEDPAGEGREWELLSRASLSPPVCLMGASAYSPGSRTGEEGIPRPATKEEEHKPATMPRLSDDSGEFIHINTISIPLSEGQDITETQLSRSPAQPPLPLIPNRAIATLPPTTGYIPRARGEDAARLFLAGRADAEAGVVQARAEAARSFFSPPPSLRSLSPSSSSSSSPSSPASATRARPSSSTSYVRRLGALLRGRRDRGQRRGEDEVEEGFEGEAQIQQIQQSIQRAEELRKAGLLKSIRCKFV